MRNLTIATCIFATMFYSNVFAQTYNSGHKISSIELVNQYESDAQRVGLDEYTYINAVQRYTQFMLSFSPEHYGDIEGVEGILPMNELPAYLRMLQGEETTPELISDWVRQKNINDAKLANFLQIEVKYLDSFVKVYTRAMASGKTIGKMLPVADTYAVSEKYIVEFTCRDVCSGFGLSPRDYVELAKEADRIKVNGWIRDFVVKFYSKDGQYLGTEVWRKNRGGTIWKERAENCDSDIACDVEP
ncbi:MULTISPECIES: hypothetical protein [Pseudoalteromonas]|uniref:DUF2059 domain-containing protein n=1 Tax=Pseudoalteromonas amylolytica TaxID=1859457 RepID=A0A1S1MRJ7_9GAMM|nr:MULTISPECIES: hypothetical protein [Pseudoalteromonas]OHU85984.1 hypothetical protein BFC16_17120 [Pseudoalteromonas sp. JW3]OHU89406.1 hypothetical protein BET10_17455 [Pseudoalteromonas amylolytica]